MGCCLSGPLTDTKRYIVFRGLTQKIDEAGESAPDLREYFRIREAQLELIQQGIQNGPRNVFEAVTNQKEVQEKLKEDQTKIKQNIKQSAIAAKKAVERHDPKNKGFLDSAESLAFFTCYVDQWMLFELRFLESVVKLQLLGMEMQKKMKDMQLIT